MIQYIDKAAVVEEIKKKLDKHSKLHSLFAYQKIKSMNEFIELVREMRNAQKEYFRTRDKNVLLKSKELERKVDSFLAWQVINQQTTLF